MDIHEFLSRPLPSDIPDFLAMLPTSPDGLELCRADLAVLRFAVRAKAIGSLELSAASQRAADRLTARGMLTAVNSDVWFPAELGCRVVRANTSCISGALSRPPAHHRETAAPDDVVTFPFTTAAEAIQDDDDITDGDLMMYAILDDIIADKPEPPPAKPAARWPTLRLVKFSMTYVRRAVIWLGLAVSIFFGGRGEGRR